MSVHRGKEVGFPSCITGHMTRGRGSASRGCLPTGEWVCIWGRGSAPRRRRVCLQGEGGLPTVGGGLHLGGWVDPLLELGKRVVCILLECFLVIDIH